MREKVKFYPQSNSIIRAIFSYIYIQLNARPVKEGYREIIYSWKNFEFKSAEPYEKRKISLLV